MGRIPVFAERRRRLARLHIPVTTYVFAAPAPQDLPPAVISALATATAPAAAALYLSLDYSVERVPATRLADDPVMVLATRIAAPARERCS